MGCVFGVGAFKKRMLPPPLKNGSTSVWDITLLLDSKPTFSPHMVCIFLGEKVENKLMKSSFTVVSRCGTAYTPKSLS